jgi:hypothetical protein
LIFRYGGPVAAKQKLGLPAIPPYTFRDGNPEWPAGKGDGAKVGAQNQSATSSEKIFLFQTAVTH